MLRQMCFGSRHLTGIRISFQYRGLIRPADPNKLSCGTIRCASHIAVASEDPSGERYKHVLKTGPHTFYGDLDGDWGAGGSAPEPKDYAFAALAMCTSMSVRLYADRRKWALKHVEVIVTEKGGGRGLVPDGLHMVLKLEGDLTNDQKKRLVEISSRNCPIKQMFLGKMPDGVQTELAEVAEVNS